MSNLNSWKNVACADWRWIFENVPQAMQILSKECFWSGKCLRHSPIYLLTLLLTFVECFIFRSRRSSNWNWSMLSCTRICIQTVSSMCTNKSWWNWCRLATATDHVFWSFSVEVSAYLFCNRHHRWLIACKTVACIYSAVHSESMFYFSNDVQ